ncbi:recombination regulator RecX [Tepidibacter formicigenes]|uniref:Regulatory protein RecX n=1 Tax=Tepidibacter formicigenes DSM 15518 TaxID=1123349 RepID=A0A1M6JYI9_9FIRM|nr:recombination regulator RecX [Tepidibacter formicigenes]SHJ51755.1 regulatory protein [Tepidibacter formicigenes DSM 15518]
MPKITKIENQKNIERSNIYVDNKFFIGVYKDIIYKLKIEEGKDVDEITLKDLIKKEMYLKAKNKALNILSRSYQSEKNIRYKLSKDEFDENTINRVICFLKEYNFINDLELAKNITKNKININKYGKNKIKESLYKKGIDKSTINDILKEELSDDIEFENALNLGKKKLEKIKNEDKNKVYRKLSQHLSYKGFDFNIIRKVINKLLDSEYNLD